jgi:hypothetical protein
MKIKKEKRYMKSQSLIPILILIACLGLLPKAQAVSPPPDGGYPGFNTAEGDNALKNLTTGQGNTALGWFSLGLVTDSSFNTGVGVGALVLNTGSSNTATGAAALILNTTGERNTAVGTAAMVNNDVGNDNTAVGDHALTSQTGEGPNTAVGSGALFSNTNGHDNTAVGQQALLSNAGGTSDQGSFNTATGSQALVNNTTGSGNTANGAFALFNNTTGSRNTAIGNGALINNTTGSQNIVVGDSAGFFLDQDANLNIVIGNDGTAADVGTIRIGNTNHTRAFIAGIREVTTGINDAINVVIDSAGQLGTLSSSRRFKKEIRPMESASETILALKPVTFHYKGDAKGRRQFGLIAEDVAEVNPDLVVRDKDGEVYTVRYDAVNAMLLNEFLKAHDRIEEQQKQIDVLTAQLKQQAALIQKVNDELQLNRSTRQVVVTNEQ